MTANNSGTQPTVTQLHQEAQNYRTSLESLLSVGRAMLTVPSLEDDSATAFQLLTEEVLESADHQADLQVVDGVEEASARVELIMQDVLTPRLTEVEEIEQALAAKAAEETDVPFTTRDAETTASQEALYSAEVLGLFRENIGTVKTLLSMEGLNVDLIRPVVMQAAGRVAASLESLGISMEALEQTQVLGDMADAVERIEALVNKAHDTAVENATIARQEAEGLGSDGEDRMGDLIEQHREENPSGVHLDEGTAVTTVEGEEKPDEANATESSTDDVAEIDNADTEEPEEALVEETDVTEPEAEASDVAEGEEEETTEEPNEEDDKKDDEEEEENADVSTESLVEPTVWSVSQYGEQEATARDIHNQLLQWLDQHELLTAEGTAVANGSNGEEFVLSSALLTAPVNAVLAKHYDVWMNGSLEEGEANLRAMGVLLGI